LNFRYATTDLAPLIAPLACGGVGLALLWAATGGQVQIWPGRIATLVAAILLGPWYGATAAAILLFMLNMIGLGFGPMSVGALNDLFAGPLGFGEIEGIRWALLVSSGVVLVAAALFWRARDTVRDDIVS